MRILLVLVTFVTLNSTDAEYYGQVGGWTPISNEEVYRRLNANIPKVNSIQRIDDSWYQSIDLTLENPDVKRNDAIKLVEPKKVIRNFEMNSFGLQEKVNNTKNIKQLIDDNNYTESDTYSTPKSIRKAKKIDERVYASILNGNKAQESPGFTENYDEFKLYEETTLKNEHKSYKVTEISEAIDTEPIKIETKSGYVYSPPEIKSKQAQYNLTNIFLNILDKYNINKKDQLTNYAKSRVPNIQTAGKQFVYLPVPIRFLEGHNSLNHLSVDPLMAVFLSNYGHYLPYSYGIHNNYRNLYGYLASNNIHNNKPFGPYKLFSDTDSSH